MAQTWVVRFGHSVRTFRTLVLARQFAEALRASGTAYTLREL